VVRDDPDVGVADDAQRFVVRHVPQELHLRRPQPELPREPLQDGPVAPVADDAQP
jgi:hypothetical protein